MASDLRDFIRERVRSDVADGSATVVVTRFPPEPNGFLHIGHAKSICLNFGVAEEFNGRTYLRFDDTNPRKESDEYVQAIQEDILWLGFDWGERLSFASDYFEQIYAFAEELIRRGKAFVCDLSSDEIRNTRGTLTQTGTDSPYRTRSAEENLRIFREMRDGRHAEGSRVLRAKIDMQSPNLNMRDPVLYRILFAEHHRTGNRWCIYPMYDFTHCICDALEHVTHSLCTLEFEDHRPLYDWVLDNININFHPPQIEFSRLGLEYNVMSKRVLTRLIEQGHVEGWDDPRLPTLAGLKRRGTPPEAIREFCSRIGVTKQANIVGRDLLDFCVRQDLEMSTVRGMAVVDPLPVTVTNFEGEDVELDAPWHAKAKELGSRTIRFGRDIYIDRSDFQLDPETEFRRLTVGGIVRLRYGFIIRCDDVELGAEGEVMSISCSYFPDSRSGSDTSGLKPKGVIQFIAKSNAERAEFRMYESLFTVRDPSSTDFEAELNPNSRVIESGYVESAVVEDDFERLQFERLGYFRRDRESNSTVPIFHRIAELASSGR